MNRPSLRRALALLLAAALTLSLFSCARLTPSEKFRELLEEIF